jgi:hypothetical protein
VIRTRTVIKLQIEILHPIRRRIFSRKKILFEAKAGDYRSPSSA